LKHRAREWWGVTAPKLPVSTRILVVDDLRRATTTKGARRAVHDEVAR
jgi:hypothetical protein